LIVCLFVMTSEPGFNVKNFGVAVVHSLLHGGCLEQILYMLHWSVCPSVLC
jgi:hypothetical protein